MNERRELMDKLQIGFVIILGALISSLASASEKEGAVNIQSRVNAFTGGRGYLSLLQLEGNIPHQAKTSQPPWSGNYWPLYQGQIAYAYEDGRGPAGKKLEQFYRFYQRRMNRFERLMSRNRVRESDIARLAPSEKYDLFLGDRSFTLTKSIWASLLEANDGRDRQHKIKDWEGICHGWAAASAYSKRPTNQLTLRSLDGRMNIPFYPDDLKALSTLLWANSLVQDSAIMEGYLCSHGSQRDYGTGKIMTTRCKGVNPGVFHLSMLGMVGQKHQSFIINKNNDEEIWNQPVHGYDFKYYNVNTGIEAPLRLAALPITAASDRFKPFRPPGTAMLVGVDMVITYATEVDPSHQPSDGTSHDELETMHVRYDLELDAGYTVLGGEWIDSDSPHDAGSRYPGFMWRFPYDYPLASSVVEARVPDPGTSGFNSSTLMSLQREAAQFRYQRFVVNDSGEVDRPELDENGRPIPSHKELRPQPLAKVVSYLVDLSNQAGPAPAVPRPTDTEEE